jgi:hypothetical protein
MTLAARLVLEDCRHAFAAMRSEALPSEWRRNLVALLTLLRAIGHVLDKVDAARDQKLRGPVTDWWKQVNNDKVQHPLFWEFIERERNSFIKQYETTARQVMVGHVGAVNYDSKTDTYTSDPYRPLEYKQTMTAGYFTGREFLEVADEALHWWEAQLAQIERVRASAA